MNSWKLAGTAVQWASGDFRLSLDQENPSRGLGVRVPGLGTKPTLELFGVCGPSDAKLSPPAPVTCCDSSLRAMFPGVDRYPVDTEMVWRAFETKTAFGIDMVVSVRTDLLDVRPDLMIGSCIHADEATATVASAHGSSTTPESAPGSNDGIEASRDRTCLLFRLRDSGFSYVEMAHPADFQAHEFAWESRRACTVVRHRFLPGGLEKGVILRARLRGVLVPRQEDTVTAASCFAAFLAADPPLGH